MTRTELIRAVQVKLEELSAFAGGLSVLAGSVDVKPITSYIDATLDESSDAARRLVPLHLINPTTIPGSMVSREGIGYLPLPEDFLRLHTLKVDAWAREVNYCISTQHPSYALQRNPHTRGRSEKPVVAIVYDNGSKSLECYSVSATATTTKKLYVRRVVAEDNNTDLLPFVILMCAIKVCDITERPDVAKPLQDELTLLLKTTQL